MSFGKNGTVPSDRRKQTDFEPKRNSNRRQRFAPLDIKRRYDPDRRFPMPAPRTIAKEISQENREDHPVVQHLQRQVANSFVLYANYKHYHWQTFGPLFRDLHLMFDEFAKDVLDTTDHLAERIRMIGPDVENVQLKQMQEAANVQSASPGQNVREMIEEADDNLLVVIRDMRDAARIADENKDPGTVDLFSRVVQIHEKHEWFLRQLLKKKDGLIA
jgi:starvation-inducible DNA-binding protein